MKRFTWTIIQAFCSGLSLGTAIYFIAFVFEPRPFNAAIRNIFIAIMIGFVISFPLHYFSYWRFLKKREAENAKGQVKKRFSILEKFVLLAVFVMVVVVWIWYWNRPPVFIRYVGYQPQMSIQLLPGNTAKDSVEQVVKAAQKFYNPSNDFWPKPVNVYENDSYWVVEFKSKKKIFLSHGQENVQEVKPDTIGIRVDKAELSCSILPAQ
jgi:hypothetical protein